MASTPTRWPRATVWWSRPVRAGFQTAAHRRAGMVTRAEGVTDRVDRGRGRPLLSCRGQVELLGRLVVVTRGDPSRAGATFPRQVHGADRDSPRGTSTSDLTASPDLAPVS